MLSLLLYHYDCLLFYHSFCPDSTNFCFSHAFQNAILKTGCLDQNRKPQYVPSRLIPTSKILKKTEREVFPLKKIASFTIDHIKLQPGIYGPMGCRTGFYLLLAGDYESKDIVPLVTEMFTFIRDFHDEVPGASPKDCGNYLDMNLSMANYLAKKYLDEVLTDIKADRLIYPE